MRSKLKKKKNNNLTAGHTTKPAMTLLILINVVALILAIQIFSSIKKTNMRQLTLSVTLQH